MLFLLHSSDTAHSFGCAKVVVIIGKKKVPERCLRII